MLLASKPLGRLLQTVSALTNSYAISQVATFCCGVRGFFLRNLKVVYSDAIYSCHQPLSIRFDEELSV
ncbi:hypothetical protein I7I53_09553 [Histoplasma capsulatum var. duboisii H88]|uniref:Uncharacterized protein n=1 Tax=Ajellomyces capsulatus (strain H88) TaxID=544711 RepID=A0A8A1L4C5_AJEC8|nr:hypothetical protein I7I53_09553 [Histoplasma capsulatum var. duboisii H88]